MSNQLGGKAAIAGIGATEFSKASGRSEMSLAVEAVTAALADAGIDPGEVDGLSTYTMDHNNETEVFRNIGGRNLKFFSRVHFGGGAACGPVMQAAMAVAAGVADVVVCYRALNCRSSYRLGSGTPPPSVTPAEAALYAWYMPYGLVSPASWVAIAAQRYMHEHGATSEDFGRITVACRKHAANNPNAWFYQKPITLEEHQASRWIVEPLRLLDCCQETDGGAAVVVTSLERARKLKQRPAVIRAAAQGAAADQHMMTSYYRDDISALPEMRLVADQLYAQAGIGPDQVSAAIFYDHFTPFVLPQIEAFGFCAPGQARHFIRDGAIEIGGRLPINTHGGQLGEGYIHGMNGVCEAVRLVRGTSVNQVADTRNVVVTAGTGVPTGGLILSGD
ncbi:lipid-transfer protein [Novosphingobium sp. ES2-1]|uniref:lipid-transfer protein n=1 Tax=Novosphingobium sp. ES2-1 TaxID=2780074 RepID=UPI0018818FAE|nr:lipid-transfer protein [Novosphingobium sp. ES2-1]QOV96398.1 lipid-transfer protein [Novosphingobium sp. ES2-1]